MTSYSSLVSSSQLTFDDEFNTFTSSPNGSVGWMTTYPYGGENARALPLNGEAEYYSDSSVGTNPFSDTNGILDITATPAVPGSNPYGLPYTSGLITTYKSFAMTYGYFEIRAELPAGQGLWPAFWLLPTATGYQSELDVFEVLGNSPTTLYFTTHNLVPGEPAGISQALTVANTSTGFHTYGVDWEPTTITLYIDGQVVATAPTPASMDSPMYMLANLAVGTSGSWPGAPNSSTAFPATMQIDYVRAYATANTIEVSGTAAVESANIAGQALLAGADYAGMSVALLNAAGTVIATTTTGTTGAFSFTGLAAGNYQVQYTAPGGLLLQAGGAADPTTGLTSEITLADGQTLNLSPELLVSPLASLAGTVLSAGAGQSGANVALLNGAGKVIATTTTDGAGAFSFSGLAPGSYQVKYTAPSGEVLQTGSQANTATGLTQAVTLAAGQALNLPAELLLTNPATIGAHTLHFGGPTDPYYGAGEGGVTVSLLDASGTVIATTVSNSTGWLSFGDIAPGTYQLQYTPPAGQQLKPGTSALTAPFTVTAGQLFQAPNGDMVSGISSAAAYASVSGSVAFAGAGQSGVTVALLNVAGKTIATTTTDGAGEFSFAGLAAGSYQLKYTAPPGEVLQTGSEANALTGLTQAVTLAAGQAVSLPAELLLANPATIGAHTLHFGGPTDPYYGAGEGGVTVSLLDASGTVIATTVSNSTGWLSFGDIAPGTYQLQYTPPAGQELKPGTSALTAPFTVTAGKLFQAPNGDMVSGPISNSSAEPLTQDAANEVVTGNASDTTQTLGAGSRTASLSGGGDSISTGAGSSTDTTLGPNSMISAWPVMKFIAIDGSAYNSNPLIAAHQGIDTNTAFNLASDKSLDFKAFVAGINSSSDLSNVSSSSSVIGANTKLHVDGSVAASGPIASGILTSGAQTTFAKLLSAHDFSLR
jgi:beta-glucanase (GH16 family)